eukprot:1374515-Amorphochlora_amoeboformis.AAC.2
MGDAMDRWAVALGTGLTLSVGFATYATLSSAGYFLRVCTKKSRNLVIFREREEGMTIGYS